MALLEVADLAVRFHTEDGVVEAVDGISYTVDPGKVVGIVGESGSGKSVSSLTVMGLTRFAGNAEITGTVRFDGTDLLAAPDRELRQLRGNEIAMIFQDPLSSLHPLYRVGQQLVETVRAHRDTSRAHATSRAIEMLGLVGLPEPSRRFDSYPHELSGGMRQRVMIAMALINEPRLLIADEPTTALDVTVQAQILDLLRRLQRELNTAIVIITHDLGVVAEITDEVLVMYAGRIVEHADVDAIFATPEHPYTWGLLKSLPRLDTPRGDRLVSIDGRPPSLMFKPAGCAFHPRCAFVRDEHRRINPRLSASAAGTRHEVACLLPAETRRSLWAAISDGATPEEARTQVPLSDEMDDGAAGPRVAASTATPCGPQDAVS